MSRAIKTRVSASSTFIAGLGVARCRFGDAHAAPRGLSEHRPGGLPVYFVFRSVRRVFVIRS